MTTGWTEGKPWEIAWGELRGEGATVGNSLGRAPLGRSDTEATIRCTEWKPWEIAWGGSVGKERDFERVDRGETVGNSMGRKFRWEGAMRE